MRAYEVHPEPAPDALRLVERPDPTQLGPDDVRVGMRAVSLNYRDLLVVGAAAKRPAPVVPCSDGAGEVIEVGSAVTRVKVGDRVVAAMLPTWQRGELNEADQAQALGGPVDGVLAEQVTLPQHAWVPLPERLTYEQGATLPCAAVTAWNALFVTGDLKPGGTVLVLGSGGVSLFALQLARACGATVIATSSSAEKRAKLEEMGAATTIDYAENPQWGRAVRAATGGRGVDVVVESGGAETFDESVTAVRHGGTLSLLGVLAGTRGQVDVYAMVRKAIQVRGVFVGSVAMLEATVGAVEAARIEPVIDSVHDFDRAREAYERLGSGKHFGKVVIRVG